MDKILMLATANIRKSKSQTISLLMFTLIAAMFLNIGLVLYSGMGSFFYERAEELHTEHFMAIYSNSDAVLDATHYIENYPAVTETETQIVVGGLGGYSMNGMENVAYVYFAHMDENQKLGVPSLIGDSGTLTGNSIYIPYFMALNGGLMVDDDFTVTLLGTEMTFTIAGFTEEMLLGAQLNTMHRFYVSDEKFNELLNQFPDGSCSLVSARFENVDEAVFLQADFNKNVSFDGLYFTLNIDDAKAARTMISNIASVLVVAFSLILLIVSLILIRFRIANSIDENMTNIGALKAVGYRNRQIVSSVVAQFCVTTFVGSIAGIAVSYALIPLVIEIMKPSIALVWTPDFDITMAFISLILIFFAVSVTAFLSARRISKLHPLIALRGGLSVHSFRKNVFPLDSSRGGLSFTLAMKQLFQNKKQSFAIGIIVAAVTMAAVAGINLNYNLNEKRDNFAKSFFGEIPAANFMLKSSEDGEAFKEILIEHTDVRKAYGYQNPCNLLVNGFGISAAVVEDCSLLESNMIVSGRYPKHPNEIALGPAVLKVSEKEIGDTITVKSGENERDYIITGLVQYMNNNGFNGIITGEGLCEVEPDFSFVGYNAYLNEGVDADTFIESVREQHGDIFDNILNTNDQIDSMLDSIGEIFSAVALGIVAVTLFVVVLTLYMVIKTMILRRKRELGIQKALGFTTLQLMNQVALNLTPVILLGSVVGAVAGYFGLNPLTAALMSSMGIVRSTLISPIDHTAIVCVVLVVLAYVISMLVAWRIRKISAYSLMSE